MPQCPTPNSDLLPRPPPLLSLTLAQRRAPAGHGSAPGRTERAGPARKPASRPSLRGFAPPCAAASAPVPCHAVPGASLKFSQHARTPCVCAQRRRCYAPSAADRRAPPSPRAWHRPRAPTCEVRAGVLPRCSLRRLWERLKLRDLHPNPRLLERCAGAHRVLKMHPHLCSSGGGVSNASGASSAYTARRVMRLFVICVCFLSKYAPCILLRAHSCSSARDYLFEWAGRLEWGWKGHDRDRASAPHPAPSLAVRDELP